MVKYPYYLKEVSLGVRLVDRNLSYWEYAQHPGEYKLLPVSGDWNDYKIDLLPKDCWQLFDSDGNHIYNNNVPDFTVLAGAIFIVGSNKDHSSRPGPGKGVVDIRRLKLVI